jgi:hypothetical protein
MVFDSPHPNGETVFDYYFFLSGPLGGCRLLLRSRLQTDSRASANPRRSRSAVDFKFSHIGDFASLKSNENTHNINGAENTFAAVAADLGTVRERRRGLPHKAHRPLGRWPEVQHSTFNRF